MAGCPINFQNQISGGGWKILQNPKKGGHNKLVWKKTSCFISYSYVPNCRDVNNECGVCVLSETLKKGVIIRRGIGTFYQKMSKISIKIFPA